MSKLIAIRVSDELAAAIEKDKRSTSDIVRHALEVEFGWCPTEDFRRDFPIVIDMPPATKPDPAKTTFQSQPPVERYSRPAHDPTCKCMMCITRRPKTP